MPGVLDRENDYFTSRQEKLAEKAFGTMVS